MDYKNYLKLHYKKFLGALAVGILLVGMPSKGKYSELNLKPKKIAGYTVSFDSTRSWFKDSKQVLTFYLPNGDRVKYIDDDGEDLKIDKIIVKNKNGGLVEKITAVNKLNEGVLKKAQPNFETWIEKIKDYKTSELMKKTLISPNKKGIISSGDSGAGFE